MLSDRVTKIDDKMLGRLLFFFVAIFAVEAINITEVLINYPELLKCIPTVKMFDASGKVPNGISSGNIVDLGNFDQCLGIEQTNNKSEIIKGKYCVMKIGLPVPNLASDMSSKVFENNIAEPDRDILNIEERMVLQGTDGSPGLILGWCVAHTCSVQELSDFLTIVLKVIHPKMKVEPVLGGMCQTKDDLKNEYNASAIILIIFLAATLCLMIISTLYDIYIEHHKKKPAHIILIAFSVKTNGQKLLSHNNNPDQLPCLNGIRFISMMWVVLGHRYLTSFMEPVMNLFGTLEWFNNEANMYMLNAPVSVDTFFVLSGILLAYVYCLSRDKGVKFNIILFYLHRYLRLTPVLAVLVWVHATILGYFGSGPFWPLVLGGFQNNCINYWWSPLVYAQNYYNTQESCIGQTWYLAVDMQLYILSPIILIPLWKWPKPTLLASAVLVLGSMASGFTVTYVKDLPASVVSKDSLSYMDNYYFPTHTRYGPWLMGLMLGYYLFILKKNRNSRITLHPALVAFGWIVGMALLLSTLYAGHGLIMGAMTSKEGPNTLGNSFFNGFHRHGWALGVCWVVYACTQGYGGPINTFLSWSLFQILGRFTYTVYLVHYSLQNLIMGASRTSNYFSDFTTMYRFWGDFMFSLAISVCLTLAYESPMITIEKVLFKTGHKSKNPELPVHQHHVTSEGGQTNNGFLGDENKAS